MIESPPPYRRDCSCVDASPLEGEGRVGRRRRDFLRSIVIASAAAMLPTPAFGQTSARVVVIGGGFAGPGCARTLKRIAPKLEVTLVEANRSFTACPLSNQVIAGMRELPAQQFG